jgi:hypothetical protein
MAKIKYCSTIENNIVELSINDVELFQEYYEKGYLIILKDFRIKINFDFMTKINVLAPDKKKKKFFLTCPEYYSMDRDRSSVWNFFKNEVFKGKIFKFLYFYRSVFSVNRQL